MFLLGGGTTLGRALCCASVGDRVQLNAAASWPCNQYRNCPTSLASWGSGARAWLDKRACRLALPARNASWASPDRACLDTPACPLALPARKAFRVSLDRGCLDGGSTKLPCRLDWLASCCCQREVQRFACRRACFARACLREHCAVRIT